MTSAKRFLLGAFVGVWGLLGLGSVATSQEYYAEPSNAAPASRAEWEQKMVRRPNYNQAAPRAQRWQAESYGNSLEPTRRPTRSAARQVSYLADGEPAPKSLSPVPDPAVVGPGKPGPRVINEGELPYAAEMVTGGYPGGYPGGEPCAECGQGQDMGGEYFADEGCCGFGSVGGGLIRHLNFNFGAHGFKGPLDNGRNGNFGFQEGIEMAGPLGGLFGEGLKPIGYQLGLQAFQSNFHGDQSQTSRLRTADRNQVFLTVGIFKRAVCSGLQWAVDFDLLHDVYQETVDLRQVRAELSLASGDIWDVGFWGAFSGGGLHGPTASVTSTNIYSLFARKYFENGGEGRIWGGFTDSSDGLVGLDLTVPIDHAWALQNEFLYMVPGTSKTTTTGQQREAWSVAANLVWYFGRSAACRQNDPFRPLLPLAGNTNFIPERKK